MTRPISKALIGASEAQLFVRNRGRIETIKQAIEKAEAKGNINRVASLKDELERRITEVDSYIQDAKTL